MSTGSAYFPYGFKVGPSAVTQQCGAYFPYWFKVGCQGGTPPIPSRSYGGGGHPVRVKRKHSHVEELRQIIEVMLGGERLVVETEPPPFIHVDYTLPLPSVDVARHAGELEKIRSEVYRMVREAAQEDEDIATLLLMH